MTYLMNIARYRVMADLRISMYRGAYPLLAATHVASRLTCASRAGRIRRRWCIIVARGRELASEY